MIVLIYAYTIFRIIKDTLNSQEENELIRKQYGQLLKIDREKSDFITITSHQLRTPLTAIRWALDEASQAPELADATRTSIQEGLDNISRLTKVVDEMFKAQELENQAQTPLKKEPLNITALIEEIIDGAQPLMKEKGVSLTFNRPDRELMGFGDREKLKTAIKVVIDNAVRYSPNGTAVVSLRTESSHANIRVEDSGIGITAEEASFIFTRFFRGKNALLVQPDGSGIGLYTARNIIERHGGDISFFSQPNKGTIFIISLPLA
ncbi:MAG: HAMP domain-containing histidine kinase [Candidatus Sungbacteria bacterium]|nr:HAMP domain-containing histidine kinase [Candidatus Sungbacteria bacterium]